jgi:hypothetical protein
MLTAMKKVGESSSKEELKIRRSDRLQAKRIAKQSVTQTGDDDEDEADAKPEELSFSKSVEQARDEKRRMYDASVRISKVLRAKRRRFDERNKLQKERKQLKVKQQIPQEVLEAISKKMREQTTEGGLESSDEEGPLEQTQMNRKDHGPFDVVVVRDVLSKPKRVNQTALNFRNEQLYGGRLKRVNSK